MATVNNPAEAKGFYEAGDFVPLLAFSDERMDAYPDVPTMKEKGSLSPLPMDEAETRTYWATQVANHRQLLSEIDG